MASVLYRATEWRKTGQWRKGEAKQMQKSTTAKRRKKEHRIGEERASEAMEDEVMDLISHVHSKHTVQHESRLRDVLHFVPTKKQAIVANC